VYGTTYRCRPKPDQEYALEKIIQRWHLERAPEVKGFIAEYVLRSDSRPGELFALVIFDSEENYRANAADPDQQAWYEQVRATLTEDPEWNDGAIEALEPATVPL
jgi:quinol monooxygenase YgiN